jgi:hypothetical protein
MKREVENEYIEDKHESYQGRVDESPVQSERYGIPSRGTNKKWLLTALGIGAVVVISSVGLSLLFAGATVTAHPKQDTIVVNASFTADENGNEGSLPFERVVLERTAKREVPALGEENVEERATGKITIYNEYSDTPQRLIKNTRFESSANNIYRIRESVEIPGKKSDGTVGSVEVTVFAEEPGDTYNITGPETFTIPGFKGMPQEGKVYAKSTAEIGGGFKGVRRSVNEQERMATLQVLETQLRDELLSAAFTSSDKPEGYHLFKEAVFFEFGALPDEVVEGDKVSLSLSGKLHGVLFPENELSKRLAQLTLSSYVDSPIRIDNLEELSVVVTPAGVSVSEEDENKAVSSSEDAVLPWQSTKYNVVAQGKTRFIWEFDEKLLAQDFAGKDKDILNAPVQGGILELYPGIDRLEVSVRPFWKGTFPESPEDIVIITELDD